MAYSPPIGYSVNFDHTSGYIVPDGGVVNFVEAEFVLINSSQIYSPYSILNTTQSFEILYSVDDHVVYTPNSLYNASQSFDGVTVDSSQSYIPFIYNKIQIIEPYDVIDSSSTYSVESIITIDQLVEILSPLDPYIYNTTFQMYMDGVEGGTSFVETHGINVTRNGSVITSTAQSIDSNSSIYFNGDSTYLKAPSINGDRWAFGTGDFTIEFWCYHTQVTGSSFLTNRTPLSGESGTWSIWYGSNSIKFSEVVDGEPGILSTIPFSFDLNRWHHVAVTRESGIIYLFINGEIVGSGSFTINLNKVSDLYIGSSPQETYFIGYMDQLRITKGISRYNSTFAPSIFPPASANEVFSPSIQNNEIFIQFPLIEGDSVPDVTFMIHSNTFNGSTTFIDSSSNAYPITVVGNVTHSTAYSYYGSSSIKIPHDTNLHYLGSNLPSGFINGDWTIDFRSYPTGEAGILLTNSNDSQYINSRIANGSWRLHDYQYADVVDGPMVSGNAHIAITKQDNIVRFFVNGILYGSKDYTGRIWTIDRFRFGNTGYQNWGGYFEELRIVPYCQWTTSFSPPAARYPDFGYIPKIFNNDTFISFDLVESSNQYSPNIFLEDIAIEWIMASDWSGVYSPEYIGTIEQNIEFTPINVSQIFIPYIGNRIQYHQIEFIQDDSVCYSPISLWNSTQFVEFGYVDNSIIFTPNIFNSTHIISPVLINDGYFYFTEVYNKNQFITVTEISDSSTTYTPNIWLHDIVINLGTISGGEFFSPSVLNFNQVINFSMMDGGMIYPPQSIFNITQTIHLFSVDGGEVYTPHDIYLSKQQYQVEYTSDTFAVYYPYVDNKVKYMSIPLSVSGEMFSPSITNLDIRIYFNSVDESQIFLSDFYFINTEIQFSIVDESVAYPVAQFTHKIRYINITTPIDTADVYPIEAIFNFNKMFELISLYSSEVYLIDSIRNKNQIIQWSSIDQSEVYSFDIRNIDQEIQLPAVDQSNTYLPSITNWIRYCKVIFADSGEIYSPQFILHPQAIFEAYGETGEILYSDLITNAISRLFPFAYSGEYLTAVLISVPQVILTDGVAYTGEECSIVNLVEAWPGLTNILGYTGESAILNSLEIDEPIRAYSGEYIPDVNMILDISLPVEFTLGDRLQFDLAISPSYGLSIETIRVSEYTSSSLTPQYAGPSLVPRAIRSSQSLIFDDFDHPHNIDLTLECSCSVHIPSIYSNINIEMGNEDDIFKRYDGEFQHMFAVLSCQHYLEPMPILVGNYSWVKEQDQLYPEIIMSPMSTMESILTLDINRHKLCKGNFIPNGNNVPIEMDEIISDTCEEYKFYDGSYMISFLSTISGLHSNGFCGEYVVAKLSTDFLLAFTGENLSVELPTSIGFKNAAAMEVGEQMEVIIYEPNHYAYVGENMSGTLVIEYNVMFIESGTLLNEYIPQTETGEIDEAARTPIAIELREFRHDLKARCY